MNYDGLDPMDRTRTLELLFRRHGRQNLQPTVPTRVEILRARTGEIEPWEVIAWLPLTSEFVAWRRDVHLDQRLKAKEFHPDEEGGLEGTPIERADHWDDEPAAEGEEEGIEDGPPPPIEDERTFLKALDLGLTEPNSEQLARLGRRPRAMD